MHIAFVDETDVYLVGEKCLYAVYVCAYLDFAAQALSELRAKHVQGWTRWSISSWAALASSTVMGLTSEGANRAAAPMHGFRVYQVIPPRTLLHDLADEDVQLAVALFADFGDFIGARFVARDGRAASGWRVTRGEIDDDAQVLSAAGEF
jgi:hypothetical protein